MADQLSIREQKYLKDLAMMDFLAAQAQLKALTYDDRYTEAEKAIVAKYLNDRIAMSDVVYKKNFNTKSDESTGSIKMHGG